MGIATVNKSLWTADGEIPLNERGVIQITRAELITLSKMHEIAQKYGISMVCQRCDHAFTGKNSGQEAQPGISCQCRELRFAG